VICSTDPAPWTLPPGMFAPDPRGMQAQPDARLSLVLRLGLALALITALLAAPASSAASAGTDPRLSRLDFMSEDGYRTSQYGDPTPDFHPDAVVVDVDTLRSMLVDNPPVLVDVMPRVDHRKPELYNIGLPPEAPRASLPGGVWLPNTGFPVLEASLDAHFRTTLKALTDDDLSRDLVFYCMTNCWMGWNAARRASEYGYESVYWYPGGADDWFKQGGDTVLAIPLMED